MRLNFLEVCLSPDLGGLELCVIDFFDSLSVKTSCNIVVAPNTKLDSRIQSDAKILLKRSKLFPLLPALKLAKYIDKYEIDIVHFHWTRDITTVVLAKLFSRRKPKVIQSRHMNMTRFKDDIYHKWLYKNIDIIHAVTKQVEAQLQRFIPTPRPEIKHIYLGVNQPQIAKKRVEELRKKYMIKDEFIVGIFGRIEEAKGQYLLLQALSTLKEYQIKALIVGHAMSEKYLQELEDKIITLDLQERVIFTGFTKEINEYILLCDVTVLATKRETFGLVVIESMGNGVPVIAVNKGGPLEIIDDEVDSLLFERNSADLAKKIALLYSDKILLKKLSKNGYDKVNKDFNKEVQMQKMYEVFSAC